MMLKQPFWKNSPPIISAGCFNCQPRPVRAQRISQVETQAVFARPDRAFTSPCVELS